MQKVFSGALNNRWNFNVREINEKDADNVTKLRVLCLPRSFHYEERLWHVSACDKSVKISGLQLESAVASFISLNNAIISIVRESFLLVSAKRRLEAYQATLRPSIETVETNTSFEEWRGERGRREGWKTNYNILIQQFFIALCKTNEKHKMWISKHSMEEKYHFGISLEIQSIWSILTIARNVFSVWENGGEVALWL